MSVPLPSFFISILALKLCFNEACLFFSIVASLIFTAAWFFVTVAAATAPKPATGERATAENSFCFHFIFQLFCAQLFSAAIFGKFDMNLLINECQSCSQLGS